MGNNNVAYAKNAEPSGASPGRVQPPPSSMGGLPPKSDAGKPQPPMAPKTTAAAAAPAPKKFPNPGLFEELHKHSKEVYPLCFDGFRMVLQKGLSNHFQVNHTLNLSGAPGGSAYHFGATYVGGALTSPTEAYPVILGDIDNTGNLQAQLIHQFTSRIKSKAVIQVQNKEYAMVQIDADYKGDDFSAAATLANVDVIAGSGVVVGHYLQRLTEHLDLGAECVYHYTPNEENASLTYAARYTSGDWELALQMSSRNWHASYFHKGKDCIDTGIEHKIGVNFERMSMGGQTESVVSLGWDVDIPKAHVGIKGKIDTNWTVGVVYEKKIAPPLPFVFVLSGMIDHLKNQSRFGIALQLGG